MRTVLMTALVALCAAASAPAEWVEQPTKIPGSWKLEDPALMPPLAKIVSAPAQSMPDYGLYAWCGEYMNQHAGIREVGWPTVRIGGPMDDACMAQLCRDGVEVMKTLGLRNMGGAHGEKRNRADFDSDEAFIAAYAKGVETFLERYGPGGTFFKDHPDVPNRPIRFIEVWNEPNFQYMIPDRQPRQEVEAEREALYAKVLPAAYKVIKRRWPAVRVVGFGAGGASRGDIRFIQHVHEKNPEVAKSYDMLSTHPYVQPVPPEAFYIKSWGGYSVAGGLKDIREILSKYGRGDAPIWYTEIGWPISQADGGHFPTSPDKVYVTPKLQAAYVCRMYALAMRLGVGRVYIMYVTDADNFNAGFFLKDKSPRPSAYAVKAMRELMPHPKLVGAVSDGADGLFAWQFAADVTKAKGGPRVIMAWNVAGPKAVELPCRGAKAALVDMLGHRKAVEPSGGKVSVEVGPCPVYLVPGE